jgi:hypothetical protein
LSQQQRVNPDSVEVIAKEYAADTTAVNNVLKQYPGSAESQSLAKRLGALQVQKENIVRRITAAAPDSVLAEASGASVSVKDVNGALVAQLSSGATDGKGEFRFDIDTKEASQAAGLDATIEKDGRKQVVPVFDAVPTRDRYKVEVEPAARVLTVNTPVTYTVKVTRADGAPVASRRVRFSDRSLTSALNSTTGEAVVWTDAGGSCQITITKTSTSASSRIELAVEDAGWIEAGEVLRLGGLETAAGARRPGGVSAGISGTRAQMDNGIISVVAQDAREGTIVSSLGPSSGAAAAGPLYDSLPAEARKLAKTVTVSGPRLTTEDGISASYEVALELPVGDGSIKKTYQVTLVKGNAFASVSCRVEARGAGFELAQKNPALLRTAVLQTPPGQTFDFAGKQVAAPAAGLNEFLSFQAANPYFTYASGGGFVFAAYPIDSETYPQSLELTSDSVGPSTIGLTPKADATTLMMLGYADTASLDSMAARARAGIGQQAGALSNATAADGFTVITEPSFERLSGGRQQVTLKVLKQYEKAL